MNKLYDSIQEEFQYLKLKLDLEVEDIDLAFEKYKILIDCVNDRFALIIHLVMLQSGFKYINDEANDTSIFLVKHQYFSQLCYNSYKFDNKFETKFDQNMKIVLNFMSNVNRLTIQAFFKEFKTENVCVNKKQVDACFDQSSNKPFIEATLGNIIMEFKNSILYQAKLYIYQTYKKDLLIGKSIIYLPNEILLKLVKRLDIKSVVRLSGACKLFKNLIIDVNILRSDTRLLASSITNIPENTYSCNLMWKYFLKRDFKSDFLKIMSTDNDCSNFYQIYKSLYSMQAKRNKKSRCNPYFYFEN